MSRKIEQLIEQTTDLASLPEVVMRAVDMLNDPEASASDIAQVISEDAGISTRLLKIVNSPFYGFPSRIDTISRAVTVVGILDLMDLILATSVVKAFNGLPNQLISMDKFWHHSLYSGVSARILASRHRAPNAERYFVAGLLHDIGSLVLYRHLPEESATALNRARDEQAVVHEMEREILGFDHAEVGAALMEAWRLPEGFIEAARLHHTPMAAEAFPLETAIVHLADILASTAESDLIDIGRIPPFEPAAWELLGLSVESVETILKDADQQFEEAAAFLMPRAVAA